MQMVPQIFKNNGHNSPKHAISSEKVYFFLGRRSLPGSLLRCQSVCGRACTVYSCSWYQVRRISYSFPTRNWPDCGKWSCSCRRTTAFDGKTSLSWRSVRRTSSTSSWDRRLPQQLADLRGSSSEDCSLSPSTTSSQRRTLLDDHTTRTPTVIDVSK